MYGLRNTRCEASIRKHLSELDWIILQDLPRLCLAQLDDPGKSCAFIVKSRFMLQGKSIDQCIGMTDEECEQVAKSIFRNFLK
jgi:hypothetical protein